MKVLVLEDQDFRIRFFKNQFGHHDLTVTDSAKVAINHIKTYTFSYLFLDNDLGMGNGEGIDVAKFLHAHQDNPNYNSVFIIHSWNHPAAKQMKVMLPNAIVAPYNGEIFSNLNLDNL